MLPPRALPTAHLIATIYLLFRGLDTRSIVDRPQRVSSVTKIASISRAITFLRSVLLLTAILADAINLGLTKIGGVPRFLRSLGFLGCRRGTSGFGLLYGSGNDILDCKTKFLYELLQRR